NRPFDIQITLITTEKVILSMESSFFGMELDWKYTNIAQIFKKSYLRVVKKILQAESTYAKIENVNIWKRRRRET
ncbi:MAG: hypothetical protein WCL54_02830, partial [Clostridia bacterium]